MNKLKAELVTIEMLNDFDPDWRKHFNDWERAAEFYGLDTQIEYDESGDPMELDFHD